MADLVAYSQLFELENPRRFIEYMRALDSEFLRIASERANSAT